MPRYHSVPLELRSEEKILGNVLSLRQVGYLAAGGLLSAVFYFPLRALFAAIGGPNFGLIMGFLPVPFFMTVAALLAFAPAGGLFGLLPGPKNPLSPDPFDPPPRLDQWLVIAWRFRKKRKQLPYRRAGYERLPNPFDRKGRQR